MTGTRAAAALAPALQRGVDGYREFLERETAALVTGVERCAPALAAATSPRPARLRDGRVPYERVEPVAEASAT